VRPTQARLFPLFLLLLFVLFGAGSRSFGERSRWVPFGCGGLGAALCLVLMVKKEETTSAEPGSGAWRAELTLLVVAGAGALGGMLAAAPAAYLFYALVSEGRSWRNALAAAVVSTVLVYFLFGVLLEVPLLRNLP
jgi:hypothetical protein